MKTTILILTLLLSHSDPIEKLTWSNFKAKPYTNDAALTVSRIEVTETNEDNKIFWNIDPVFVSEESFTTTTSEYILNHERLHYQITELYANKIKRLTEKYNGCSILLSKSVNIVIHRYITEWNKTELQYDKESLHGLDSKKQKEWEDKINNLIFRLQG